MKKIIFSILACLLCNALQGQTISGTIYDAKTKETIPGAAIYLNGTTMITTSDAQGRFTLVVNTKINANLVLSHLSYESLIIEKPFDNPTKEFYMQEKVNTLDVVRVVADRYTRAAKMWVFKQQFLGTGAAGKSCTILNEEDISLNYDYETNSLIGSASKPIIVENKYLRYRVIFDLHHFCVTYSDKTLNMEEAISISFFGTSSYVDQSPYNIMYAKRREETYLRSSQNFWRNFANHTLEEAKFRIYNKFSQIDPDQYFRMSAELTQKTVTLIPETNLNLKHNSIKEEDVYGVIGVAYKGNIRSEIVFLTDTFSIDSFGNPDKVNKLMYFGDMGDQRLGDMLPQDFVYVPQQGAKR